jgi:hypothetical protein
MKTIHQGSNFSIPLHPEHHKEIAKLKDEQEHKFKTEDGKHWTARRKGDDVHFQGANGGNSTQVKHSTMTSEEMVQEREDDEYHTPSKHHVQVQVSKGDGPKTHRTATVRAKEPEHAVSAAISHYKQQGYTVHDHKYLGEEVEIDEGFGPTVNVDKVNAAGQEPHEEKWEPAKKVKKIKKESFDNEGNIVKSKISFSDFLAINEIKMADLPSRSVKGRSYGADYEDPEGAFETKDDMNKPDSKKAGRKVGQKVGARANLGNSKLHQA